MQQLELNDGTVLEDSYAAETTDYLFLYINNGMTMMQIMMLMVNPDNIRRIVYSAGENMTEYTDYTTVYGITVGYGGMINVSLRRNS